MKTTKIIVEEAAASPEACGTFTFSQSSRKSEICVEEVASYSLNAPFAESVISDHKETLLSALIEETESDHDLGSKMSRSISIVSCSEDERTVEKDENETKDDAMEELMKRIHKQRSILGNIITEEATKVEENDLKRKESLKADVSEIVEKDVKKESLTNGETDEKISKELADDESLVKKLETVEEKTELKEDIKSQEVETEKVKLEEKIIEEDEPQVQEEKKMEEVQTIQDQDTEVVEEETKASTVDTTQVENITKVAENSTVDIVKVPESLPVEEKVVAKEEHQPEGIPINLMSILYQISKTGMKMKIN